MSKCWVCYKQFDEDYEISLDVLPQQYMISSSKYKLDIFPTPKYMGICPLCSANGVSDAVVAFTNTQTTACVAEYIRANLDFFTRRLYERANL